jgi:hypothetical protein
MSVDEAHAQSRDVFICEWVALIFTPILQLSLFGICVVWEQQNGLYGLCSSRCKLLTVQNVLASEWHRALSTLVS